MPTIFKKGAKFRGNLMAFCPGFFFEMIRADLTHPNALAVVQILLQESEVFVKIFLGVTPVKDALHPDSKVFTPT
jgi:hypothetical protein